MTVNDVMYFCSVCTCVCLRATQCCHVEHSFMLGVQIKMILYLQQSGVLEMVAVSCPITCEMEFLCGWGEDSETHEWLCAGEG
jgi:hypothetical protein